jgi:hypothetical protein
MIDGKILLYFVWGITICSLFLFIPRGKVRLAWVAFLFEQVLTWPLGLVVADRGLISYPVNFLENATRVSFTYEYLFLPAICAYFLVYFPNDNRFSIRATYYIAFCTVLTLLELLVLHYTNLVRYIHWNASFTWLAIFITFYVTRKFCLWFFGSLS